MLSQLSYAPERSSAGVASLATSDIISYPGAFVNTFFDFFRIFFEKENSRSKFRSADRNGVCAGGRVASLSPEQGTRKVNKRGKGNRHLVPMPL